jgi:2-hydroxychromene-2-carboxylate isomerase
MKTLEFFFDVGSAASYLAYTQLPALAREAGATIAYKPMLLGAVFQATGNQSPMAIPAKGRYTGQDFGRFAQRYRVPFAGNPFLPINTLMLMRGATGLQLREP